MNLTSAKFLFAGAMVSLAITGCKKNHGNEQQTDARDLNAELRAALEESSNGEGLQYFVLPESYQYNLIPQDPLNPLNSTKVQLGKLLFHETGIGLNPRMDDYGMQTYSCASCHHAQGGFQANMRQGIGEGGIGFGMAGEGRAAHPGYPADSLDVQPIRTPTAMNGAYQKVTLWNGQFGGVAMNLGTEAQWSPGTPIFNNNFGHEGLETQAIAGLTVHRMVVDEQVCQEFGMYEDLFDIAFPDWPQSTRYTARTAGMAIAAYERTLLSNQAPWQDWLRGNTSAMSDSEKRGAIAFFGKANCGSCHNGPALNSMSFHAIGMGDLNGAGIVNGNDNDLGRGGFTQNPEDDYKFKTPQLYNLKDSPFYGHGGTFTSVHEVIEYKNNAVPESGNVPETQLADSFQPLGLSEQDVNDLTNFIEYGLYDANLMRYAPGAVPSGNCFPNNDAVSIIDQGCME